MARKDTEADIVERGDIYFLYRPDVRPEGAKDTGAHGVKDVERFYMVMKPEGAKRFRMMVVGRKHLPDLGEHERTWGFVDKIARSTDEIEEELGRAVYGTKTRGERIRPAARPAGEGVYALVRHGRNVRLAYSLELPKHPGPVQKALKIAPEGSIILSVKNPDKPSPRSVGLGEAREADYPKTLRKKFGSRRFAAAEPELLDYEGAEFVMIGADEDVSEDLGIELEGEAETEKTADLLKQLHLARSRHPAEPLFKGGWG